MRLGRYLPRAARSRLPDVLPHCLLFPYSDPTLEGIVSPTGHHPLPIHAFAPIDDNQVREVRKAAVHVNRRPVGRIRRDDRFRA